MEDNSRSMYQRIISVIVVALLIIISSTEVVRGQSIDSLLYLIDNDLVEDDSDRYELLCQVIENIKDAEIKMQYSEQAIELADKLDIIPDLPYLKKGEAYLDMGKHASALDYFLKAASYYKENDDRSNLGRAQLLMAETYNLQGNHDSEKQYLQKAIEIFKEVNDSFRLAIALQNLGYFKYGMGQYDTALVLYALTGDLFKDLNMPNEYFYCLGNLGLVHSRLSDFDKAEDYLLQAIDTLAKLGDKNAVAEFMIGYANILQQKGQTKQAISYASRVFKTTDNPDYERDASLLLARLYAISNRFDSAYYFQSICLVANDSMKNIVQKMADLIKKYELDEKQAEVDALEKDRHIRDITIIGLVIILLLAFGLVTLYYNNLRRSKKLGAALEERRVLLEKQSSELKEKNDKITRANKELKELNEITSSQKDEIISSINYAKRIQSAILPPETYITELLNENFIFYKPKDIVSGDFYWIKQVNHYIILVAADCTGHGVPGAFMSMLGISYLNEIVQRREITQANEVLNELRKQIKQSLRQSGKRDESRDGIDIALCALDTKTNIMQYAGAYNPLYLIVTSDGKAELKEIKADKMPVGVHFSKDKSFTNHEIKLDVGDTFYIFSDGFADQIGGKDDSRFGSKRFMNLLLDINEQAMYEQKENLEESLIEWMGDNPQRDDILVIGARV